VRPELELKLPLSRAYNVRQLSHVSWPRNLRGDPNALLYPEVVEVHTGELVPEEIFFWTFTVQGFSTCSSLYIQYESITDHSLCQNYAILHIMR